MLWGYLSCGSKYCLEWYTKHSKKVAWLEVKRRQFRGMHWKLRWIVEITVVLRNDVSTLLDGGRFAVTGFLQLCNWL